MVTSIEAKLCGTDFWVSFKSQGERGFLFLGYILIISPDSFLQDTNSTWYTDRPRFSQCFRDTALVWLPACVFLLALIGECLNISKAKSRATKPIAWNLFNKLRIFLTFLLAALKLSELSNYIYIVALKDDVPISGAVFGEKRELVISTLLAPIISALCYTSLIILYCLHRKTGIHTSRFIWFYMVITLLCGSIDFYSVITSTRTDFSNAVEFAVRFTHFPILALLFIFECHGDTPALESNLTEARPESPESQASFCSSITFWWYNSFLLYGYKCHIKLANIWPTLARDMANNLVPIFRQAWTRSKGNSRAQVYHLSDGRTQRANGICLVLFKLFWVKLLAAAALKFLQDSLQYLAPMLLKMLLQFMSSDAPEWHGSLYAMLLLVIPTIQSMILGNYFYHVQVISLQVRTMIVGAIYRKALLLSGSSRMQSTSGEIVNLMSVDSHRFQDLLLYLNLFWSAPFQIILAVLLLYRELGWSIFAGVACMALVLPCNAYLASQIKYSQVKLMKIKDERVKQMNELLSGIKVIKLYAWENSFISNLLGFRNKELERLSRILTVDAIQTFLWQCSPFVVALVTFAVYVNVDDRNVLSAEKAFVSISLFNLLRFPLTMLPSLVTSAVLTMVSARRLNNFLNSDELIKYVTRNEELEAISIEGGTVAWIRNDSDEARKKAVLKDIDFHVKRNSFVAVVGQVASGKSSLLSSILGDLYRISGRFNVCKSMNLAYVPQQAWIQNMTVKENILFGSQYNEERYKRVLSVCSLESDLETLPGGDQAEIGEKGINLSGGQKQRVSLARACYSDSDIFLLDDPLSALDSHVAKHVFEKVLSSTSGILRNKTRVLATNSLFVLPHVDQIVVLDNGRIVECGTYKELMAKEGGHLADYMQQYSVSQDSAQSESATSPLSELEKINLTAATEEKIMKSIIPKQEIGQLIELEKLETGSVNNRVYFSYFKSVSLLWLLITAVSLIASTTFNVATNLWLSEWSSDADDGLKAQDAVQKTMRLVIYAVLGGVQCLTVLSGSLGLSRGAVRASRELHARLLNGVMHSPMAFFDTTPIGRVVNRFAKDVDVVDSTLPGTFRSWLTCFLQVASTIFVICYSFPAFLIIIVPLAIIYYLILSVFIVTTRQLKRLESITRSPIYSHFNETLSGISTIRAYNCVDRFVDQSDTLVDRNQSCSYLNVIANRWLSVRLEFFGNLITAATALFSVYNKGSVSAGVAGLTISYSLSITQTLSWLVRMTSDLETHIVSVERILEYIRNKQEDKWIKSLRPREGWPNQGAIQIQNYSTRYREDTELVLKGLSIDVKPQEKIGIVGRTGSGKSSLSLSLFRLLEPTSGKITIDKLNLVDYGLHDIRSKLTIIPQDPVLFSGTLRFNLDPLGLYSDLDIWRALESAHLKAHVSSLGSGLDHLVSEFGENFSVGQRQLICLARAILRKTKILILDEATASVDLETDTIVQKTIREIFNDCTIITIAHRLHTILDSDRILVLDNGRVKELDKPVKLIRDPNSAFASLVRDAGLDTSGILKLAEERRNK